jgi:hypothetical protein
MVGRRVKRIWCLLFHWRRQRLIEQAPAALPVPKVKRQFKELPPATQAAFTCREPRFWAWLREEYDYECSSEDNAADFVRAFCKVESRGDLKGEAEHRWKFLVSAYEGWKNVESIR